MAKFNIELGDKPNLERLLKQDRKAFQTIVGTFVSIMEIAAEKNWHKLPEQIHSSISFADVVTGVLNAIMTTREIDPKAYAALEDDLHPLALLSDKRKDLITGEPEYFNWRNHFSLDTNEVSRETVEKIIRSILYLVRWFDIESVSKALMSSQFPIIDQKDVAKLPFQPALKYQQQLLGDLHVGKFFHEVGAFNCGEIEINVHTCPACNSGDLQPIEQFNIAVCPKCNAGFSVI